MTTAKMETPADVLADIEQQLENLGDPGDVLNTDNAQAAYYAARSALWNRRQAITTSTATLAAVEPKIAADEQWLADLINWRKILQDELLALRPSIRDAHTQAVAKNLVLSIDIIDRGTRCEGEWTTQVEVLPLGDRLRAAGYVQAPPPVNTNQAFGRLPWFGSMRDVEGRLKELRARRDDAQRRLDAAVREAAG